MELSALITSYAYTCNFAYRKTPNNKNEHTNSNSAELLPHQRAWTELTVRRHSAKRTIGPHRLEWRCSRRS